MDASESIPPAVGGLAGGEEREECEERATRAHEFLASRSLAELPDEVFRLGDVWSACERCAAEGDARAAERLYERLVAFAGGAGAGEAGAWAGTVSHYLGVLAAAAGRCDAAVTHFEAALRNGAAGECGRTQLAFARALLARGAPGDDGKAQHLLAALIASWHRLGGASPSPAAAVVPAGAARAGTPRRFVFRREGEYWALAGAGRVSRLRGLRGFEYVAELLRHPHRPIYVVELAALAQPPDGGFSAAQAAELGLRISNEAGFDGMLDRRARHDYRARWHELLTEEAEARRDNDPGRAARAQREIEMLAAELTAAGGRGAATRGCPSFKERARVNVRNCISAALRAIRRHDEVLWRHLSNSIKTGTFCCYGPDRPVEWDM